MSGDTGSLIRCNSRCSNGNTVSIDNIDNRRLTEKRSRDDGDDGKDITQKLDEQGNDTEEDELTNYALSQEVFYEGVKLQTNYKQENKIKENVSTRKAKKRVKSTTITKNSRPKNDGENSSFDFISSSLEEDEKIDFDFNSIEKKFLEN
ncbi:13993_t:CDS:2 [Funneliformis caledonium]|uniref:13993_t:CDS:1 n=1 Tax=Funneliformis caledonium TaxID=1117310 RepID=A0A9N8V625_9GLOM|nr:13993_t:CDS:2 [Funneliformis caledonium]